MPDRVIFEYAVIRLVPRVEREEFVNIGVIVMSQRKKFLDVKYHIDQERIQCFSKDLEIPIIENYLKSWKVICSGSKTGKGIESLDLHLRFRWLTANRSTIIQSSSVHSGICHDPEKVLEDLFQKHVS
ncbi:MAG: hypothetical protein ACI9FN_002539 [Saprospiraceae bacterium]|jgi:hypothetical protein